MADAETVLDGLQMEDLATGQRALVLETQASLALLRGDLERTLALPSTRSNAVALGKTRLQSCRGRFASAWLVVCPTSDHFKMNDEEFKSINYLLGSSLGPSGAPLLLEPLKTYGKSTFPHGSMKPPRNVESP